MPWQPQGIGSGCRWINKEQYGTPLHPGQKAMTTPNRLSARYKQRRARPLVDALIAFRMGRAGEDHYYELTGALFIAAEIVAIVARHRHLKPDTDAALAALEAIHEQRTIDDAFWAASESEIVALELGVDIYTALLDTTPGKQIHRAMVRVKASLEKRMNK